MSDQAPLFGTIQDVWPECSAEGCTEPKIARGLCAEHYRDHRAKAGGRALKKWAKLPTEDTP